MESLRGLLRGASRESRAALAVELLQQSITAVLPGGNTTIRAMSIRQGTGTVGVNHSAVAARIQQQEHEIIETANKKISRQLTGEWLVKKITCRITG